jgi:hypothetical protein
MGKAQAPVRTTNGPLPIIPNNTRFFGNELTLYAQDTGENYITKGYNLNDAVYSIVSKNAEKAGQVRLYHARIKKKREKDQRGIRTAHQRGPLSRSIKGSTAHAKGHDRGPGGKLSDG